MLQLYNQSFATIAGGELVIVNGPTAELGTHVQHYNEVQGFVLNMRNRQLVSKFGPNNLQFQNPHDVAITEDGNAIYVAELDPKRIHKFLHKSQVKPMALSALKVGSGSDSNAVASVSQSDSKDDAQLHHHPSVKAIMVASLMLLFAGSTFALTLIMARRRKRGNQSFSAMPPSDLVYRELAASNQTLC